MKKLRLEKWTCDNNEEEIHFFDGSRYVLGYNPKLIEKLDVRELLELYYQMARLPEE